MKKSINYKVCHLDAPVESTYTYLLQEVRAGRAEPGTVCYADYQTAGRGQAGNSWYSSEGLNALPSIYLELSRPLAHIWAISEAAALAVYDAYRELLGAHFDIKIKWPNDLMASGRKIAGILIHNELAGGMVCKTIIGIGMNLNERSYPESLPQATSSYILSGRTVEVRTFLDGFLEHLARRLSDDSDAAAERQHRLYNRLLFQRDCTARYKEAATGAAFDGEIIGVSPRGELLLNMKKSGVPPSIGSFRFKELIYL